MRDTPSEEGAPLNASHAAAVEIDQAGDVFISYASQGAAVAEASVSTLEGHRGGDASRVVISRSSVHECVAVDGIYADRALVLCCPHRSTRGRSLSSPSQRPVLLAQPSQRSVKMLRLEVGP
jgi:hypothetical protein